MPVVDDSPGQLADKVMHFARLLRGAGMPVATDRVQLALVALQLAGIESRQDFRAVLGACLLDRIAHRPLFDQAFALFWRAPDGADGGPPEPADAYADAGPPAAPATPGQRRLGQALFPDRPAAPPAERRPADADWAWTDRERLQHTDFDSMTVDEWRAAQRLLSQLRAVFEPLPTRRSRPAPRPGRADWRATLQSMARSGGELAAPRWRRPRSRPAPLVVLADISASMRRYSRMLLHFAHGMSQAGGQRGARVESFVFGTRLTRCTHLLAGRDPDIAVAQVMGAVQDWSGGTRITGCLHDFNQHWARRVLGSGATVLLISDGLEQGDTAALAFEMARLHRSCRRLVWLNPLLRFDGFEPRAAGIRAMLPHVDRFLPAHNLRSLQQLVDLLRQPGTVERAPQRAGFAAAPPAPTIARWN